MVGVKNGGGPGALNTGATVLSNTTGRHSYGGINFTGVNAAGNHTADAGQRELLIHVKGNDQSVTGDNNDRVSALLKSSLYSTWVRAGTYGSSGGLSSSDISYLKMDMASSNWVVGNFFPSSGVGHCVVVKSYSSSAREFYYYDPWTNAHAYVAETSLTSYISVFPYGNTLYRMNWFNWCKY
jgi:hypothetical protein